MFLRLQFRFCSGWWIILAGGLRPRGAAGCPIQRGIRSLEQRPAGCTRCSRAAPRVLGTVRLSQPVKNALALLRTWFVRSFVPQGRASAQVYFGRSGFVRSVIFHGWGSAQAYFRRSCIASSVRFVRSFQRGCGDQLAFY